MTDPPLCSPATLSHLGDTGQEYLFPYMTDSTTRQVWTVDVTSGERDGSSVNYTLPFEVGEAGLVLTTGEPSTSIHDIDRYRGYTAKFDLDTSNRKQPLWLSEPTHRRIHRSSHSRQPAAEQSAVHHLSGGWDGRPSAAIERLGRLYGPTRVRTARRRERHTSSLLEGCTAFEHELHTGCLWVVYQPVRLTATERTVIAVTVLNGTVVCNWTTAVGGAEAVTASTVSNAHLA